ncbi:MAG TPA: flippase [Candidatus Krumholzibacteria bacterium]|nr:flippase [Candidatus Krumholzibacteria bacterium]
MRGTRGVLQNIGILAFGQAASQALGVVALVFLARHLGTHWFGVVQIGVTFMTYTLIVAEWGMISTGIRGVSRLDDQGAVRRYVRTHMGLMAVQALVVLTIGAVVLPRLPFVREDPVVFWIYLLSVVPQVFLLSWAAAGLERMTWVGAAKIARAGLYAVFVLALLIPLEQLTGLAPQRIVPALYLLALTGAALIVGIPLSRWIGGAPLPVLPTLAEARERWRQATPIAASVIVLRVLVSIDLIVLGVLATPEVAGNYAAASRIIALLVVAIEVLWSALLPRFSRLAKLDPAGHRRAFNLYFGFVCAALLPVAVGGSLVADDLMAVLYGAQFPDAGPVFSVLIVSTSLLALGMFLGNALISENRQSRYVPAVVVGAVVAVVGAWLLVPRLGGIGAAFGMAAGHTLLFVGLVGTFLPRFDRSFVRTIMVLLPALAVMAVVVELLGDAHVFVRVVAGGVTYGALALWPLRGLLRTHRTTGPGSAP